MFSKIRHPDYRRMIDTAGAAQATETTETAEGR